MAGSMYNQGVNLFARDGVTPVLSKIESKTTQASMAMMAYGSQMKRVLTHLPAALRPFQVSGIARNLLSGVAFYGMARGIKGVVDEASRFEVANVQFDKLIGNTELAKSTLLDLRDFAARTPFEFKQSQDISRQLLAFGVTAKELIPIMTQVGNLGLGDPEKISQIAYAYGRIKDDTYATARTLRMFTTAGVPIRDTVAKIMGLEKADVSKALRKGAVSFKIVSQAMESLTGEGGKFNGMMWSMLSTVAGLKSNFRDVLDILSQTFGATFQSALKSVQLQITDLTSRITSFVEAHKEVIRAAMDKKLGAIAQALARIDVEKLYNFARAFFRVGAAIFKAIIIAKIFTTVLLGVVSAMVVFAAATYAVSSGLITMGGAAAIGMAPILITIGAILAGLAAIRYTWAKISGQGFWDFMPGAGSDLPLGDWKQQMQDTMGVSPDSKDGFSQSEPVGIGNSARISQIEHTTSQNSMSNFSLSVAEGLTVDAEGDIPPGFDMAKLNNASILS